MRIIRLMSTERQSKPVLTESQWRSRYSALVCWYFRKAKQDSYKTFAVFTVL